jgi:hypothetical protein
MSNSIKSFKMVTGEEIVAEIHHTVMRNDETIAYALRRPHVMQLQQMGPNQVGLAFVPWTLSNPNLDVIEVPVAAILVSFEPSADVERQYLQQTSGIALGVPGGRF